MKNSTKKMPQITTSCKSHQTKIHSTCNITDNNALKTCNDNFLRVNCVHFVSKRVNERNRASRFLGKTPFDGCWISSEAKREMEKLSLSRPPPPRRKSGTFVIFAQTTSCLVYYLQRAKSAPSKKKICHGSKCLYFLLRNCELVIFGFPLLNAEENHSVFLKNN